MKRAGGVFELMDARVDSADELEANLADIAFANRWFGGIAPLQREIARIAPRSVLDIGCGGADVPLALVRAAERSGSDVRVTCLDANEAMIAIARKRTGNHERLTFVHGNGAALPFDDNAFDVVTCSLAMHHFEPAAAASLLYEMRRVARVTPIVSDLLRSTTAYVAAWLYAHLTTTNRLTRNDAPLSVRRAYTTAEAIGIARAAGWASPHVRREPFFRMTLLDA